MGTKVSMTKLPWCDTCEQKGRATLAEFDAKTIWGPWAYMCRPCWESLGEYDDLGTGKGQQLELRKAGGE